MRQAYSVAVAVVHSGGGGGGRRWWWWGGGSRDKSILIGAKVEIMTKLTQGTSRVPSLSLSSFSPALILLLLFFFFFPSDVIQPARQENREIFTQRARWRPYIYTHKYVLHFFFLSHSRPRPVFYSSSSSSSFVDCNYCPEYISGSQSLFPAFIPLFLAPPQPAPGAIHQAERRDRQQRQEEKQKPVRLNEENASHHPSHPAGPPTPSV